MDQRFEMLKAQIAESRDHLQKEILRQVIFVLLISVILQFVFNTSDVTCISLLTETESDPRRLAPQQCHSGAALPVVHRSVLR